GFSEFLRAAFSAEGPPLTGHPPIRSPLRNACRRGQRKFPEFTDTNSPHRLGGRSDAERNDDEMYARPVHARVHRAAGAGTEGAGTARRLGDRRYPQRTVAERLAATGVV